MTRRSDRTYEGGRNGLSGLCGTRHMSSQRLFGASVPDAGVSIQRQDIIPGAWELAGNSIRTLHTNQRARIHAQTRTHTHTHTQGMPDVNRMRTCSCSRKA